MNYLTIHDELVQNISKYKTSHAAVLESLIKADREKVHIKMGYANLWNYLTVCHKLCESDAGRFIQVLRASQNVPELKEAVVQGEIAFTKAACIATTITKENKVTWLEKAKNSSLRSLQKEIIKENPKAIPKQKITPRTEEIFELKGGVTKDTLEAFKRVQDLLSQSKRKAVSFDETIKELAKVFTEKKDPVVKAQRAEKTKALPALGVRNISNKNGEKIIPTGRVALPSWVKHEVFLKSNGRCMAKLPDGSRCDSSRFLEIHHRIPLSQGGTNHPGNLNLLCSGHHKGRHL